MALDRLRGVALVAMLVHHLVDWSTGDARAVLPGWRAFTVTDAAAVMFFVAAGASMALFVGSRRGRGLSHGHVGAQILRRYGLLVPVGMALDWVLWRDPLMCGVLEVLGVTVVLGAAVAAAVPARALPVVAAAVVWGGVWSEQAVAGREGWWSTELIGGKFPLVTYLGFVLVGVAAVRCGWFADRRKVAAAAGAALLVTLALLADGLVPDRYPGDVHFVVPGLAVTIAVYALAQLRWVAVLGRARPGRAPGRRAHARHLRGALRPVRPAPPRRPARRCARGRGRARGRHRHGRPVPGGAAGASQLVAPHGPHAPAQRQDRRS